MEQSADNTASEGPYRDKATVEEVGPEANIKAPWWRRMIGWNPRVRWVGHDIWTFRYIRKWVIWCPTFYTIMRGKLYLTTKGNWVLISWRSGVGERIASGRTRQDLCDAVEDYIEPFGWVPRQLAAEFEAIDKRLERKTIEL